MDSAVGQLIKKAREARGLSQTDAGKLINISEQFLGRVEVGSDPLPLMRARRLQKVLKINRRKLLSAFIKDYKSKVNKHLKDTWL